MFTQAGFRDDFEILGRAKVGQVAGLGVAGGIVTAQLLRWPTGEIAWGSQTKICWPHQAFVYGECKPELLAIHLREGGNQILGGLGHAAVPR